MGAKNKIAAFDWFNWVFLLIIALLCMAPIVNILAISLSGGSASTAGTVAFWPVDFTFGAYEYVALNHAFWHSAFVSVQRVFLGVTFNMALTVLAAYPLSFSKHKFRWRGIYAWYLFIPMVLGGGLIPTYFLVHYTGLMDSIWALIIPGALPVFNVFLLSNFMKELPGEIMESASIDGAGHVTGLVRICLPLCKPVLATLTLFCFVGHWNSWFDGLIYMNSPDNYPLQSYLQTVVVNEDPTVNRSVDWRVLAAVSDRNVRAAQIFLASIPIFLIYPFLQKYFAKGIVLGSVKG